MTTRSPDGVNIFNQYCTESTNYKTGNELALVSRNTNTTDNNNNGWLLCSANLIAIERLSALQHTPFTHVINVDRHSRCARTSGLPRFVKKNCLNGKCWSWVLSSDRVGRFHRLAGSEFQTRCSFGTGGGKKEKEREREREKKR